MAWKVDGKIGYLATGQQSGNPQQDTYRILYQAPGQNTQTEIEKVYYLAPGGNPATDLQLVWHRYMDRTLVAGDKNVAIEYTPTTNITVNSIEIFTSQTQNYTSGKIKILHESGLYVGAIDGNTTDSQTERYNLTGVPRSVSNVGVTLYAGKTYYIVFNDSSQQNYYPTYFQNENGNYREYANTTVASNITPGDLSNLGNFLGGLFSGRHPNKQDKLYMLSMSINDSFVYLGYNSTDWNPALVQNHFYRKKSNTYANTTEVNITSGDDHYKAAKLFGNIKKYTTVLQNGSLTNGSNYDGSIAKMATGYTSCIDVDSNDEPIALTTWPSSPQDNGLYYIDTSLLSQSNTNEFVVYHNNNWDRVGQYYMSQAQIANYVNYPDWWNTDFEDMNVNYTVAGDAFTTATVHTDRKYYIKINGNEV